MRVATFDLGTNTFRVLMAEVKQSPHPPLSQKGAKGDLNATVHPIRVLREITRLGQDLHKRATFHPDAVKRCIAALDRFNGEIRKERVTWAGGICTAAFRTAKNGPALLKRIRNRYGWDVRIVSAKQEATYAMRGILRGLHDSRFTIHDSRLLVIDIGGGSTEFIVCDMMRRGGSSDPPGKMEHLKMLPYQTFGRIRGIQTTPLGVVRLTESHLHHDPPLPGEMNHLNTAIDRELVRVQHRLLRPIAHRLSPFASFIGTAGTVTTLAALKRKMRKYDPKKISGTRLSRRDLENLMRRLIAVTAKARLQFPGMEKGREDLILAGIAILLRCMDRFHLPALTVSDSGILEGIALAQTGRRVFSTPGQGDLVPRKEGRHGWPAMGVASSKDTIRA